MVRFAPFKPSLNHVTVSAKQYRMFKHRSVKECMFPSIHTFLRKPIEHKLTLIVHLEIVSNYHYNPNITNCKKKEMDIHESWFALSHSNLR